MRTLLLVIASLSLCACPAAEGDGAAGAGGSGTGGSGGGGGAAPCVDYGASSSCHAETEGLPGGCPFGQVCALASARCPGGETCCSLPKECAPQLGELPAGASCVEDTDCRTGRCLTPRFGASVCFRACDPGLGTGCPEGQYCALLELEPGISTHTCLGGSATEPELARVVCRADADCAPDRRCRMQVAAGGFEQAVPIGTCELRPEGLPEDDGKLCGLPTAELPAREAGTQAAGLECEEHGLCAPQCRSDKARACRCSAAELVDGSCLTQRCAIPCRADADCPPREICGSFEYGADDFEASEHRFRICQLPYLEVPQWGCRDELDCCHGGVQRDGRPCCPTDGTQGTCDATTVTETACRLMELVPGSGRAQSVCTDSAGLALPGEACAEDAACATGLCVSDGAGGKACSTPCEAAHDRCDSILAGSRCCPTQVGALCVEACRFDCGDAPDCAPR